MSTQSLTELYAAGDRAEPTLYRADLARLLPPEVYTYFISQPTHNERFYLAFWALVDRSSGPSACWPWKGRTNSSGYGILTPPRSNKLRAAHRIAYLMAGRHIPYGYQIDHVAARGCTMHSCCNPAHLEAVTQKENLKRRDTAVAARKAASASSISKGHAHG